MKVLILPSWYPSAAFPISGIFINEQAINLAKKGIDVSVAFLDASYKNSFASKLEKNYDNGIKTYTYTCFGLPKINKLFLVMWAERYYQLYKKYEMEHGVPDIIHAHSFIAGYAGAYIKSKIKRPLVLTEHHPLPFEAKPNKRYLEIANSVFSAVDKIIAVSEHLEQAICRMGYTNTVKIYNPVNTNIFYPATIDEKSKSEFKILAIGGYERNKGMETLIEAIAQLNTYHSEISFKLNLYGGGRLASKYKKMLKTLSLESKVQINGVLSRDAVAEVMRKHHLFCLPSHFESFGMTLIEACATGLPVIGTAVGGPKEIINENNGLWLKAGDSEQLAAAILTIYRNYEMYDAEIIVRDIKSKYSESVITEQIIKVYQNEVI